MMTSMSPSPSISAAVTLPELPQQLQLASATEGAIGDYGRQVSDAYSLPLRHPSQSVRPRSPIELKRNLANV